MNETWADQFRRFRAYLKKSSFPFGIRALRSLRGMLMEELLSWQTRPREDFWAQPFAGAKGYHGKTLAYSIWHIFRIEDIVVQSLMRQQEQILFSGGFAEKIGAPILTTGNELQGADIQAFSRALDVDALYAYAQAVRDSTDAWLQTLEASDLSRSFTPEDRARLESLGCVSPDENAEWLLDYWCGKDWKGLMLMPLSRHWIMHIEASKRILARLDG